MKNDSQNSKSSIVFQTPFYIITSLVLGVVALVLRAIQVLNYIDFKTGFYTGPLYLTIALNITLVLAMAVLIIMTFLDKNEYEYPITKAKSRVIGIFALLMGMALAFYATTDTLAYITENGLTMKAEVIKIIIQYLAAISLMYMAMSVPSPNRGIKDLIHLLPCIWACITLVSMFLQHTIVVTVTENLYNLIRMAFTLMFFFFCAKYYAGFSTVGVSRGLVICGYMTFVLGCVCTFPVFISHIANMAYTGDYIVQASFLDLAISLYAFIYTSAFLSSRTRSIKHEDSVDEVRKYLPKYDLEEEL